MGKILKAFAEEDLAVVPVTCRGNPQYREATDTMGRLAKQLREKLNEEGNQPFEQFCDAQAKAERIYARDHFIAGYRTDIPMTTETVTGSDNLVRHDDAIA